MPITPTEFGSTPFLLSRYFRKKSVEEPGALTPTFLSLRSFTELILPVCFGDTTSVEARIAVIDHEGFERLVLGGEIDAMVEIAGHHVGAAADHRGERLRAALEIDQFDLDAGLFVFAELLGQHGRQIAQAARPADRDGDLRLRGGCARHQRQRAQAPPRCSGSISSA